MIEIMKETDDNLLAIKVIDKLTAQDYQEVLIPRLEKIIYKFGSINALIYLPENFKGWELKAICADIKLGFQHRTDFNKIAIVGGSNWVQWIAKAGACLITGELAVYQENQLQAALEWVNEK